MQSITYTLVRNRIDETGCFGQLTDQWDKLVAYTLEHSYSQEEGGYAPKLPAGTYTCLRGLHQLEGMSSMFPAFEVQKVPGHSGILLHVGNTQDDSNGCILLGSSVQGNMLLNSRIAFNKFMGNLLGTATFTLVVTDPS